MTVLFLGPLPPPVHGFSAINQAMLKKLQERAQVDVFDRSPALVAGTRAPLLRQVTGWLQLVQRFHTALRSQSPISLYAGFSGGRGQLLDLPFFLLARLYRLPTHLHHHSFAYLNKYSRLTSLTLMVAKGAQHIVLCDEMAARLEQQYGVLKNNVNVVSNAAFLPTIEPIQASQADAHTEAGGTVHRTLRVGFLSNITEEKGIFEFFDVIDSAVKAGFPIKATIAGPVDSKIAIGFQARLTRQKEVTHIGPVYGEKKQQFYRDIDVLLFPTKYKNEAEPVTILEAQQLGVAVLAASRGCIGGMIEGNCGIVAPIEEYKTVVISELERMCSVLPAGQDARRRTISAQAIRVRQRSLHALQTRLDQILSSQ